MLPSKSQITNEAELKELPHAIAGSFEWLTATPQLIEVVIGKRSAAGLPSQLEAALVSAKDKNATLPPEIIAFIRNATLHDHLRSVTACYLDVAESLLPFLRWSSASLPQRPTGLRVLVHLDKL